MGENKRKSRVSISSSRFNIVSFRYPHRMGILSRCMEGDEPLVLGLLKHFFLISP
jgi:hypothetical protein